MNKQTNLSENLKRLSDIAEWFDSQETVDVEEGLTKVKEAAILIKQSKQRLQAIENEFHEIKKEIDDHAEVDEDGLSEEALASIQEDTSETDKENEDPDNIHF